MRAGASLSPPEVAPAHSIARSGRVQTEADVGAISPWLKFSACLTSSEADVPRMPSRLWVVGSRKGDQRFQFQVRDEPKVLLSSRVEHKTVDGQAAIAIEALVRGARCEDDYLAA